MRRSKQLLLYTYSNFVAAAITEIMDKSKADSKPAGKSKVCRLATETETHERSEGRVCV